MRDLVISDVHANVQALDAVLADARRHGFDRVLCLGDLVGYGGDPEAACATVLALNPVIVRGNHDKVAAGIESAMAFHDQARQAIEWTRQALPTSMLDALRALPCGPLEVGPGLWICHGAPFDEDHYIFDARDAARALSDETIAGAGGAPALTLFGHTHVPAAFARGPRGVSILLPDLSPTQADTQVLPWDQASPMLVNVGAVGQPRDGDPRAAYGIIDSASRMIEFHRVEYDIKTAQERILAAGLPERLATRLDRGA